MDAVEKPKGAPRPPEDPRSVVEVRLRDGSRVWIRPIRPSDRPLMEQGLRWLSPRSRYLRFHTYVSRLTNSQLDYLTDVDHHDHEALVAIDPDGEGQPGVGVARYIRLEEDPTVAEAAVTVIDAYQGLGIGTALIGRLERLAWERGIRTFRNYVLAENQAMLGIFSQLEGRFEAEGSGLYRVDVPIPAEDDELPDTPAGRWVAEVGRAGAPGEGTWAYPVMWFIRHLRPDWVPVPSPSRLLKMFTGEEEPPPEDGGSTEDGGPATGGTPTG